jgi:hypothetical protein
VTRVGAEIPVELHGTFIDSSVAPIHSIMKCCSKADVPRIPAEPPMVHVTRHLSALAASALLMGCAHRAGNAPMWKHFDAAADLHEAIVLGSVEQARLAGQRLAEHHDQKGLPQGSEPLLEAMRQSARQIASAHDLSDAALGTAQVAVACGNCHETYQRGPLFSGGGVPPTEGVGVGREMRRHAWGAGRLWEGLIGPSDPAWTAGARALVDAPLSPDSVNDRAVEIWHHVAIMETRVHDLGQQALTTTAVSERAQLYAELLTSCAACHARLRGQ